MCRSDGHRTCSQRNPWFGDSGNTHRMGGRRMRAGAHCDVESRPCAARCPPLRRPTSTCLRSSSCCVSSGFHYRMGKRMRALVVVLAMIALALGFAARGAVEPAHLIPPQNFTNTPRVSVSPSSRGFVRPALPTDPPSAVARSTSPSADASPVPRQRSVTTPPAASVTTTGEAQRAGSVWDRLAQCESRNEWAINTGNGYYGGLQENLDFWRSYGDPAYARPDLAPKAAQIAAAVKARDGGRGYRPWPQCSKRLGLS